MLDVGADLGFSVIGFQDSSGHGLPLWLLAVNLGSEAILLHGFFVFERAIGRVRPHHFGRVGFVQQIRKSRAIKRRGVGHCPGADQSKAPIRADVVLVAESRNGQINGGLGTVFSVSD